MCYNAIFLCIYYTPCLSIHESLLLSSTMFVQSLYQWMIFFNYGYNSASSPKIVRTSCARDEVTHDFRGMQVK